MELRYLVIPEDTLEMLSNYKLDMIFKTYSEQDNNMKIYNSVDTYDETRNLICSITSCVPDP